MLGCRCKIGVLNYSYTYYAACSVIRINATPFSAEILLGLILKVQSLEKDYLYVEKMYFHVLRNFGSHLLLM